MEFLKYGSFLPAVTLLALLAALGEQGLLVFCGVLAAPFLLPVTVPGMSTVLGLPMLVAQAERQFEWLTGQRAPAGVMKAAALSDRKN